MMMRGERSCIGAPVNRLENGCFKFKKTPFIEKPPDTGDDVASVPGISHGSRHSQ